MTAPSMVFAVDRHQCTQHPTGIHLANAIGRPSRGQAPTQEENSFMLCKFFCVKRVLLNKQNGHIRLGNFLTEDMPDARNGFLGEELT